MTNKQILTLVVNNVKIHSYKKSGLIFIKSLQVSTQKMGPQFYLSFALTSDKRPRKRKLTKSQDEKEANVKNVPIHTSIKVEIGNDHSTSQLPASMKYKIIAKDSTEPVEHYNPTNNRIILFGNLLTGILCIVLPFKFLWVWLARVRIRRLSKIF